MLVLTALESLKAVLKAPTAHCVSYSSIGGTSYGHLKGPLQPETKI